MSPWDAHVSRGLMESEGIPAFLASEHHVWAHWPLSLALGGVRLQVPTEQASRARDILAQRSEGEFEAALIEQTGIAAPACLQCGASAVREQRDWFSVLLSFVFIAFGNAIFPPGKRLMCAACGSTARGEA